MVYSPQHLLHGLRRNRARLDQPPQRVEAVEPFAQVHAFHVAVDGREDLPIPHCPATRPTRPVRREVADRDLHTPAGHPPQAHGARARPEGGAVEGVRDVEEPRREAVRSVAVVARRVELQGGESPQVRHQAIKEGVLSHSSRGIHWAGGGGGICEFKYNCVLKDYFCIKEFMQPPL